MNTSPLPRRDFLKTTGTAALAAAATHAPLATALAEDQQQAPPKDAKPESTAAKLYASLTPQQRKDLCFDWNYRDPSRGLLRTHVSNNWSITRPVVNSPYFTDDQRSMIREIFERTFHPDWHQRIDQQLKDDAGGFGNRQSIAIFGAPDQKQFEFVMTGRHMTMRSDGNTTEHVAFGGPIFYGHDPQGEFYEGPDHEGNIFWDQALSANQVYQMLDGKQRRSAEVARTPAEGDAGFRGAAPRDGIPVADLSADQKGLVQQVLKKLLAPYREVDRQEVLHCLESQNGLDACHLAFYTDDDIGGDRVWDNWRLEGPSFVWHFRGAPHVHVWVSIADDPSVAFNSPFQNRANGRQNAPRRTRS